MDFDSVEIMGYANTVLALLDGPMKWMLGLGAAAFIFGLINTFMGAKRG